MSKVKYSVELKIRIVKEYLSGDGSYRVLGEKYGVSHRTLEGWVQ